MSNIKITDLTIDPKAGNAGRDRTTCVVGNNGWTISFRSEQDLKDLLAGAGKQRAMFDNVDGAGEEEDYYIEGGLWFSNGNLVDYDGVSDIKGCVQDLLETMDIVYV